MKRVFLFASILAVWAMAEKAKAGRPAPEFSLSLLGSDENINLKSFRGKVVLLDFWASWCAPCRKLMPKLSDLKTRNPKLVVLAVSVDESKAKALAFLRRVEPGLKAAFDSGQKAAGAYGLQGMPSCFLIDKKGNLRFRHDGYGAADMEKVEQEARLLAAETLPL